MNNETDNIEELRKRISAEFSGEKVINSNNSRNRLKDVLDKAFDDGILSLEQEWIDDFNVIAKVMPELKQIEVEINFTTDGE